MLRTIERQNIRVYQNNMDYIQYIKNKSAEINALNNKDNSSINRMNQRKSRIQNIEEDIQYAQTGAKIIDHYNKPAAKWKPIDYSKDKLQETTQPKDNTLVIPYRMQSASQSDITSTPVSPEEYLNQQIQKTVYSNSNQNYSLSSPVSPVVNTDYPRGIRNNNWLNIRINNNNDWLGKVRNNTDGEFEQFETPEHGIRAAVILLRNYAKEGNNTLGKIIGKWAPQNENHTKQYTKTISEWTGIDPEKELDLHDTNVLESILYAMAKYETGEEINMDTIRNGIKLI